MKRFLFALLGKDPEAVVVSFWSGQDDLALRMIREVLELIPDRRHYVVSVGPAPEVPGSTRIESSTLPDGTLISIVYGGRAMVPLGRSTSPPAGSSIPGIASLRLTFHG